MWRCKQDGIWSGGCPSMDMTIPSSRHKLISSYRHQPSLCCHNRNRLLLKGQSPFRWLKTMLSTSMSVMAFAQQMPSCSISASNTNRAAQSHSGVAKTSMRAPSCRIAGSRLNQSLSQASMQLQVRSLRSYALSPVSTRRTATMAASSMAEPEPLPVDPLEMVAQAARSIQRGIADGKARHRVDFLLPVNEKELDFGATESMDYPCSIMKEYETAVNLTKLLMQTILGSDAQLTIKRIDAGGVEGEPCGVMMDESKAYAAVIYPTSDKLKQMRALAEKNGSMLLMVNPQWNESGQIVSDFGIGPWKKKAYDFLDTFEPSYSLIEKRIGAPGSVNVASGERFGDGGVLRYLRCYPAEYEVFAMAVDGSSQLIGVSESMPSYKESEAIIAKGREAKLEIFQRAREVSKLQDEFQSSAAAAPQENLPTDDPDMPLSESIIDAMDAVQVKRALAARNIPTSGKMAVLRKRLKEAALP